MVDAKMEFESMGRRLRCKTKKRESFINEFQRFCWVAWWYKTKIKLRKTKTEIDFAPNLQDLVSTFYFLRNHFDLEGIQVGETASLHMIYDKKPFAFRFRFLGYENVKTKFGVVPCVKFRPYVEEGRIFKKESGLSLWVSNDNNRIPIKVVAELSVGSLDVDLVGFKGLKHPFNIIVNE